MLLVKLRAAALVHVPDGRQRHNAFTSLAAVTVCGAVESGRLVRLMGDRGARGTNHVGSPMALGVVSAALRTGVPGDRGEHAPLQVGMAMGLSRWKSCRLADGVVHSCTELRAGVPGCRIEPVWLSLPVEMGLCGRWP